VNVRSVISTPLNSYRQAAAGPTVPQAGQPRPAQESAPAAKADSTKSSQSNQAAARPPQPSADPKPTVRVTPGSNIVLKIEVDEKTHEITVYMVDRQSKKVVRTIPASEVARLSAGDLLRLTA
jgi:hypothetical protein